MKTYLQIFIGSSLAILCLVGCQKCSPDNVCDITDVSKDIVRDTNTELGNITIEQLKTTAQYANIDNVDQNLLNLDIYYPSDVGNPKAIVLYVHGGGWSIGDKSAQLENKINLFQSLNYVFVSVNYRLSPFPYKLRDDNRIKYPIHNEDLASSIAWVVNNISQYGGDASKIALMGHSAGAHLVSLTGTNETFLEAQGLSLENISGIISIDTEGYDISEQIEVGSESRLFENAFGSHQSQQQQASPLYNISAEKNHPPFFIGKRIVDDKVASTDSFINTLKQNHIATTTVDGSEYSHAGINDAIGNPDDTIITPALIHFLEEIFE